MAVRVLGGAQTDFARSWSREAANPLFAMLAEVVPAALAAARVDPSEVDTAHVGNFAADRFAGQAHLGSVLAMLTPEWSALPASRHEAACASGSMAVLAAMAELEAGRYDVALVVGVELMRNVGGQQAARHLGPAAWTPDELSADVLPWPHLFDRVTAEVDRRYGVDQAHLGRIAELNRANARRNPLAQTRNWDPVPGEFTADDDANPVVVGRTRRTDCGRITDGACAVVLAGPRCPPRTGASVIRGWGHHCAPTPLSAKLELADDYLFPTVRKAITAAYGRAGVPGPEALSVIETHDCFTVTEYVALEHFGLTQPGRAFEAIEDGRIEHGGALPVNPSGGLIGAGHPVGATGVRMLLDAHRQVTGTAGEYQVPGAHTAATLNIGGSFSTAASFVVGAE